MAGFEPASERIDPRISTSVVMFRSREVGAQLRRTKVTSRLDPKVLFPEINDVIQGTSAL